MDRRQQKTRDAIFRAFTALLARKSASAITVQEIIDEANIGRATFYAHFETKDYLLKALCEELFAHVLDTADGHGDGHSHYFSCDAPDSVFLHLLQHLQKNDNHILELLSCQNNDLFLSYFKANLQSLIRTEARRQGWRFAADIPEDYAVNHIAAAFVETVRWWIDCRPERSPDMIADYFRTAVQPLFVSHKEV